MANSKDLSVGTLVRSSDGWLEVVPFHSSPLHLMHLSPKVVGHGWLVEQTVEVVAPSGTFDLVAVEKGVIPSYDMGQVITGKRFREIAKGVGTSDGGSPSVHANRSVHWCRHCGPCEC